MDLFSPRVNNTGLCTGNKYQFDLLRRAKHSTMMTLYHLHNPDAPAHLYTCNECQQDILTGQRMHCDLCNNGDFDLCQSCHRRVGHIHRVTPVDVTRGVTIDKNDSQKNRRVVEMRRARQRSLQLFLQALVHSSSCRNPGCNLPVTSAVLCFHNRHDCFHTVGR